MSNLIRRSLGRRSGVGALTGAIAFGGLIATTQAPALASSAVNRFVFSGAYRGTLKFSPSDLSCTYGKTYSGKGYLITISHMSGTISGAGRGPWAVTAYVPKVGTTKIAHADVNSYTDTSFQGSSVPIIAFRESSGTIVYNGSRGSLDLTVVYQNGTKEGKTATVQGSWSC